MTDPDYRSNGARCDARVYKNKKYIVFFFETDRIKNSIFLSSAKNKGRLSLTQWFHIFVALVLTAKLSPAILDNFDIFVLALEEQNIPKVSIPKL